VYAGDGSRRASKAFADVAYDAQIQGTGKDAKLWLSVSGMNCGKKPAATFAEEAFCERPIEWNAKTGKFDFAPVSAIKTMQ